MEYEQLLNFFRHELTEEEREDVEFDLREVYNRICHARDSILFHASEMALDNEGSCSVCDGWFCPTSPNFVCDYTVDMDDCDYCHGPEERK